MQKSNMSAAEFRAMLNLPPAGPTQVVTKIPRKVNKSKEKAALDNMITRYGINWRLQVIPEHRFHPVRMWRFDWFFPELKTAIEFNGLAVGNAKISRHQTVTGITGDCEKINQAQIMGFTVLQYTILNYEQFATDFPLIVAAKGRNIVEKK